VLTRRAERSAFTLCCLALLLAPLLFGAVRAAATTVLDLFVLVAGLLVLGRQVRHDFRSGRRCLFVPRTGLFFLFAAFLLFLAAQMAPLPLAVVQAASGSAAAACQASVPPAQALASLEAPAGWARLAPYAYPVRMSLVRWIVYGSLFYGLVHTLRTRRRIETAIACVLAAASAAGICGLLHLPHAGPGWTRFWLPQPAQAAAPAAAAAAAAGSGMLGDRDGAAALLCLGLLLSVTWSAALSADRIRPAPPQGAGGRRRWLEAVLRGGLRLGKRALALFAGLVAASGLLLSGSRAGIVSAAAGLIFLAVPFLFLKGQSRLRRGALGLVLVFLAASSWAVFLGMPAGTPPAGTGLDTPARETREALKLFRDWPLAGIGLGAAPDALALLAQLQRGAPPRWEGGAEAARFLAEGGVAALLLLSAGLFGFFRGLLRAWRDREDPFAVCLGLLPGAAAAAAAVQCLLASCLRTQATALTFTALVAAGFCAVHLHRRREGEKSLIPETRLPLRTSGGLLLALLLGSTLWATFETVRHAAAEAAFGAGRVMGRAPAGTSALSFLRAAARLDAGNAFVQHQLAQGYRKLRDPPDRSGAPEENATDRIVDALEAAVARNPLCAPYHQDLAWEYSYLWERPDYAEIRLPAADRAMRNAGRFARGSDGDLQRKMGNYWLLRSRSLSPASGEWAQAVSRAGAHYRTALSGEVGPGREAREHEIRDFVWTVYPDASLLQRLLAPDPASP